MMAGVGSGAAPRPHCSQSSGYRALCTFEVGLAEDGVTWKLQRTPPARSVARAHFVAQPIAAPSERDAHWLGLEQPSAAAWDAAKRKLREAKALWHDTYTEDSRHTTSNCHTASTASLSSYNSLRDLQLASSHNQQQDQVLRDDAKRMSTVQVWHGTGTSESPEEVAYQAAKSADDTEACLFGQGKAAGIFKTGSGIPIRVSAAAKRRAHEILQCDEEGEADALHEPLSDFKTGMADANWLQPENAKQQLKSMSMFTSGSGRTIEVSEASLKRARCLLNNADDSDQKEQDVADCILQDSTKDGVMRSEKAEDVARCQHEERRARIAESTLLNLRKDDDGADEGYPNEEDSKELANVKAEEAVREALDNEFLGDQYVKNVVERRVPHRAAHLALCQEHVARDDLLLGGPLHDPVDSAVLVFHVGHISDAEQFAARDPYVLNGLVIKWWIRPWAVVVGCDQSVERLPPVPVAVTPGIGPVDGDNLGQAAALPGDVGISGMTGFATSEGRVDGLTWCWEMRSVNGRTLDVKCRLPDKYLGPPAGACNFCTAAICARDDQRHPYLAGRLLHHSWIFIVRVLEAAEALEVKLPQLAFSPPLTTDSILRLPGILDRVDCRNSGTQDGEVIQQLEAVSASMAASLEQLALSRRAEGTRLASVLCSHLTEIAVLVDQAARLAEAQPKAMKEKLRSQVEELLETGLELDRGRLEQEAAYLATRMDVREELDRLRIHVKSAEELLISPGQSR
eukprot:SM000003S10990  [mRNA]  locus=s3:133298:141419:- [translate_table: standard]